MTTPTPATDAGVTTPTPVTDAGATKPDGRGSRGGEPDRGRRSAHGRRAVQRDPGVAYGRGWMLGAGMLLAGVLRRRRRGPCGGCTP
ncbi:MAG: hypothetical protein IPN17_20385 [Deltaproteobacteria bacterium]|nr:hypothetical protein [Deltaproteobacteria bacterium]